MASAQSTIKYARRKGMKTPSSLVQVIARRFSCHGMTGIGDGLVAFGRKITQLFFFVLDFPFKDHGRISQDLTLSCTPALKSKANVQAKKTLRTQNLRFTRTLPPTNPQNWSPIFGEMAHCVPASFTTWPSTQPELIPDQTLLGKASGVGAITPPPLSVAATCWRIPGNFQRKKAQVSPKPERYHKNRPLTSKFPKR